MTDILCPLTQNIILNPVTAADGFTYEKDAILNYIRRHHKSPISGEPLELTSLVINNSNYSTNIANENDPESCLDIVRTEVSQCLELKKQSGNFEPIPPNLHIFLKKDINNWSLHIESINNEDISEALKKNIQYNCSVMHFYINGDNSIYTAHKTKNNNLSVNGSFKINKIYESNKIITIKRYSSFVKELAVKSWLDNINSTEILSIPLRCILGLNNNKSILQNKIDTCVFEHLNKEQNMVFTNDYFKSLEIIEGPPGTGKTSVISALIDFIEINISSYNTNHYTIVLSEKNRGVDAVSERLSSHQYDKTLSFGSYNMGESTKKYDIENRITSHDIVQNWENNILKIQEGCEQKIRKLKRLVFNIFPKKIYKEITWKNIDYFKDRLFNCGVHIHNTKKQKINIVLLELNELIEEYNLLNSKKHLIVEEAKQKIYEECKIILVTFGSLHQVCNFLKETKSNLTISIIVDESSTLLSWQGFYLEHFINNIEATLTNMILVGDSKQLPPYWPDNEHPNIEKKSFLDMAKKKCEFITLTQQYRLPNQIMNILNKEYYKENLLILGNKNRSKGEINWIHSDGVDNKETNESEINQIIRLIYKLSNINTSIMIISPYKAQCDLLTKRCSIFSNKIKVMTLDSVQGNESDIVVISLVKATPTSFLTKKRTCVMISRARQKLFIFGNRQNSLSSNNGALRRLARFSGLKLSKIKKNSIIINENKSEKFTRKYSIRQL